ncbi:MAG TPA: hypothetical protein VLM79_12240 [Kofleriaceae bacterium]|nr:hypothetical protein [Kofleriaceae bacterium]
MRLVICVSMLLTGCLYLDPINEMPLISPVVCVISDSPGRSCGLVHRGDLLQLTVDFDDADGDRTKASFSWKAHRCSGPGVNDCDRSAYDEQDTPMAKIEVPSDLAGVQSIRVNFELRDERGAAVAQAPRYTINDAPTLETRQAAHSYVVGGPVELYAKYGDLDDGPLGVAVQWDILAPAPSAVALTDLAVPPDFTDLQHTTAGKLMVPDRTGAWDIRVTASDGDNAPIEKHLQLMIGPDEAPCIAQSQPLVPPDDDALPIAEPTRFQVPLVIDDLDPYPPLSDDPHFGTTAFEWSILAPDSPERQILVGATGNSVELDPDAFTPGDIVELRVEVFDRNRTAIRCPDGDATCSVAAQSACIQRQTWRVEVR